MVVKHCTSNNDFKLLTISSLTEGYVNISNCLSIGEDFDRSSADVGSVAKDRGFWDGEGSFDFAKVRLNPLLGSSLRSSIASKLSPET